MRSFNIILVLATIASAVYVDADMNRIKSVKRQLPAPPGGAPGGAPAAPALPIPLPALPLPKRQAPKLPVDLPLPKRQVPKLPVGLPLPKRHHMPGHTSPVDTEALNSNAPRGYDDDIGDDSGSDDGDDCDDPIEVSRRHKDRRDVPDGFAEAFRRRKHRHGGGRFHRREVENLRPRQLRSSDARAKPGGSSLLAFRPRAMGPPSPPKAPSFGAKSAPEGAAPALPIPLPLKRQVAHARRAPPLSSTTALFAAGRRNLPEAPEPPARPASIERPASQSRVERSPADQSGAGARSAPNANGPAPVPLPIPLSPPSKRQMNAHNADYKQKDGLGATRVGRALKPQATRTRLISI